jgi:hypothetical protein
VLERLPELASGRSVAAQASDYSADLGSADQHQGG